MASPLRAFRLLAAAHNHFATHFPKDPFVVKTREALRDLHADGIITLGGTETALTVSAPAPSASEEGVPNTPELPADLDAEPDELTAVAAPAPPKATRPAVAPPAPKPPTRPVRPSEMPDPSPEFDNGARQKATRGRNRMVRKSLANPAALFAGMTTVPALVVPDVDIANDDEKPDANSKRMQPTVPYMGKR